MAIDPTFLDQLKKLNFLARRKVSSVYMGTRRSIKQGRGMELYDHRRYYPGDDFRSIDWKLYGKTEKLYIRRFEEEKNLTLHILVDSSTSMDYSTTGMRKFDYAGSIAAGFAFIALNKYEKFAAVPYSDRLLEVMPARKGRMHFFRMISLLDSLKQNGETNLGECMNQYTGFIKTKSFIIVISDFLEPIDSLRKGIYRVAKRSKEAILIQVLDPGEINLGWRDDINFEDMESSKHERAYLSPNFRRKYVNRLREHIFDVKEICDETKTGFFSVNTKTPLFDAFVSIVEGRKQEEMWGNDAA
ncbi:MAG: DUF58 domain-containing protein [Candidatus Altiarchaeota archaeon]|nr:DUF58 domain-containing protein [Candidatus Altiarchaeota archaeon]